MLSHMIHCNTVPSAEMHPTLQLPLSQTEERVSLSKPVHKFWMEEIFLKRHILLSKTIKISKKKHPCKTHSQRNTIKYKYTQVGNP